VDYYVLETRGNVTGLNIQATVRYRGIRAGRVENITTDDKDPRIIVATISLDSRYKLTRKSTAKLNTQGLTGLAYVQIEDDGSSAEPLTGVNGALPRLALQPSLFDTLGAQAGDIATQVGQVAARLSVLLDERNLRNISRSLDNLAATSEGLKELPQVIASLRQVLSESNLQRLSATLGHLEKTTGEATPMVQELRQTIGAVAGLAHRLDKLGAEAGGELAGGTLPRANAAIQELTANARQLSRLLESLERNPQALVFGRAAPAPGPGEVGYAAPSK
jgi:phospholipid/cholesterol/gamma-HCH transport system substrate-binding protein